MKVLLPAPLGPSNPIAPADTCRVTPSSARCGPKTLLRFCVSMTGAPDISKSVPSRQAGVKQIELRTPCNQFCLTIGLDLTILTRQHQKPKHATTHEIYPIHYICSGCYCGGQPDTCDHKSRGA